LKKLEIRKVSKSYFKDDIEYPVLLDINFDIADGEILCILGSSGCGKTTLLRLTGGFELPDSGEILLKGQKIIKPNKDRIMLFQDFQQLFPWKTVLENVMLPLNIHCIGKNIEVRKKTAQKYLSMVQLEGYEHYFPYQLSGGMKQRAAIARSLALEPEILLMDEPFANLDAQTRNTIQKLLLEIWKQTGITILFVTHDIQEAITISQRIVILNKNTKDISYIIENQLPRPRTPNQEGFGEMFNQIYDLI